MKQWKIIPGYEDYEASNQGDIRNRYTQEELYKCNTEDYVTVNLRCDDKTLIRRVNQLVALAFLSKESEDQTEVNHIDRIKNNNVVDNLEWCTPQENTLHFWSQYGSEPVKDHVYMIKDGEVKLVTCKESKELRNQGWNYGNGIDDEPWVIKGKCYIHRKNEEKLVQLEYLNQYIEDGWKRGRLVKNLKAIKKEGVQKFIAESELEDYINKGWELGSIKSSWYRIIRNEEEKLVSPEILDDYLKEGWEMMRIESNTVNIHLGNIDKTVKKSELDDYRLKGWRYGSYRCGLQNKRWINNGFQDKCIDESELNSYLNQGWKEGRILSSTRNKRSMVKNGIQKFFSEDEIEQKLSEGWKFETISTGNKGRIWMYKKDQQIQIMSSELEKYKKDGWQEGRPRNMIFVSNDKLNKCIKISEKDLGKYLKEGWRRGRIKKH